MKTTNLGNRGAMHYYCLLVAHNYYDHYDKMFKKWKKKKIKLIMVGFEVAGLINGSKKKGECAAWSILF